ncbi:unnamed protein product, partial [Onchocerca flexuosa]|uniref:DUF1619 domain-containing protein n=1 Tax=Onchocerca flexuosa TaxID=387005 RepID=A0A183HM20_9BILA
EETVEIWDDGKVTPFEYPAKILSDQCTGTAPLPLSKNISMVCLPQWNMFDEKHCIGLKYLNVSYYLRKYSTQKNGNRTIVSMESTPEKNRLIQWLHWNGTACNNAVSSVLIKFIVHDGLLEDVAISVHYVNTTKQNCFQQFYRFEAIFVGISPPSNAVEIVKPMGYEMGQTIRTDSISINTTFSIPYGMECDNRKQQINIRFGIQINTACRLRFIL